MYAGGTCVDRRGRRGAGLAPVCSGDGTATARPKCLFRLDRRLRLVRSCVVVGQWVRFENICFDACGRLEDVASENNARMHQQGLCDVCVARVSGSFAYELSLYAGITCGRCSHVDADTRRTRPCVSRDWSCVPPASVSFFGIVESWNTLEHAISTSERKASCLSRPLAHGELLLQAPRLPPLDQPLGLSSHSEGPPFFGKRVILQADRGKMQGAYKSRASVAR